MITKALARERWRGVVVPVVTPFREDGALNLEALAENVRWLLDRGAQHGNTILLAAGSGGDFTSMTIEERKQVIRTIAESAAGRVPVIAGAQSVDIRDCLAICNFCEKLPIDAVQISGPFYYDGRSGDVLDWMKALAENTSIGFALYNNWYTGYDMPFDLIDELLQIPNSIGIRFGKQAAVVDNTLTAIPGHLAGCGAFVSHFPNFWPEFPWRLWDLMESGEYREANAEFNRVMVPYLAITKLIAQQTAGEGVFVRPAMQLVGLTGGHSRLPSRDNIVTSEIRLAFHRFLTDVGAIDDELTRGDVTPRPESVSQSPGPLSGGAA
jgi:dihydrodipicolinate synthase/N-acetylneuraminate lyase